MQRLRQPINARGVHDLTLDPRDPALEGPWEDEETFTVNIWPGDGRELSGALTDVVAWKVVGSSLRLTLTTDDLDTLDLEPGTYRLQVLIDPDFLAWDGELELAPGPGQGEPRPIYATAQDLLDELPWLEGVEDLTTRQSGFREELAQARDWLDGVIVARCPWPDTSGVVTSLAADGLDLTGPDGKRLKRACALRAAFLVLRHQIGTHGELAFSAIAKDCEAEAESLARTGVAWLGGLRLPLGGIVIGRG
jgi:hypothetical protein